MKPAHCATEDAKIYSIAIYKQNDFNKMHPVTGVLFISSPPLHIIY